MQIGDLLLLFALFEHRRVDLFRQKYYVLAPHDALLVVLEVELIHVTAEGHNFGHEAADALVHARHDPFMFSPHVAKKLCHLRVAVAHDQLRPWPIDARPVEALKLKPLRQVRKGQRLFGLLVTQRRHGTATGEGQVAIPEGLLQVPCEHVVANRHEGAGGAQRLNAVRERGQRAVDGDTFFEHLPLSLGLVGAFAAC